MDAGVLWRPGVSEAFVALQDEHGADVNVMLALLWLAAEGQAALEAEAIERLDMAVADWRAEIVEPLRRLRRALKGGERRMCGVRWPRRSWRRNAAHSGVSSQPCRRVGQARGLRRTGPRQACAGIAPGSRRAW